MQGNESFRLVVRRGPQPNQVYELNKDIITLGRDITNDIVINDPEASRHHLRLTRGAGGFTVEDLGSTNGTFINGRRLTGAQPLNNGDMVGLGETVTLGYEIARAPGAAQGSPPSPPAQQPVSGEQGQPYPPPASPPAYQPPQQPYSPPAYEEQRPSYEQQYDQGQSYSPPAPAYGAPGQQAAYDYYDPYAAREEEPRSATRWILIGCVGLTLFCCCSIVIGLVIIDGANLWCRIPIFKDTVTPILFSIGQALGFVASGGAVCP